MYVYGERSEEAEFGEFEGLLGVDTVNSEFENA